MLLLLAPKEEEKREGRRAAAAHHRTEMAAGCHIAARSHIAAAARRRPAHTAGCLNLTPPWSNLDGGVCGFARLHYCLPLEQRLLDG